MNWGEYLTNGIKRSQFIYHLAEKSNYENQHSNHGIYFPPAFKSDGFIHATAKPEFLLQVANNFYRNDPGKWICLEIDEKLLKSPLIYEQPLPVGNIAPPSHGSNVLFPHIYGGLNTNAVTRIYEVQRSEDGGFTGIADLVPKKYDVGNKQKDSKSD